MLMRSWWKSLRHAARGIIFTFRHERNFQIECGAAFLAVFLGFLSHFSLLDWVILLIIIGWVLTFEMMNTVAERILDIIKPNVHPYVRVVKDMAAGMVLVTSFLALLIGILLFLPHWTA